MKTPINKIPKALARRLRAKRVSVTKRGGRWYFSFAISVLGGGHPTKRQCADGAMSLRDHLVRAMLA